MLFQRFLSESCVDKPKPKVGTLMMTTETTFSTNSVRFIQKKKTLALQIQLEVPHLKARRAVVPGKDSRDLDGSLM